MVSVAAVAVTAEVLRGLILVVDLNRCRSEVALSSVELVEPYCRVQRRDVPLRRAALFRDVTRTENGRGLGRNGQRDGKTPKRIPFFRFLRNF